MAKETKWSVDHAHSQIGFKVRHLMISHVKGNFNKFDASIYTTAKDFTTAQIDLWIDATSISTGDVKRDEHLKSADFFDVDNHKQITFTASTIGKANGNGNHELWGELTMKGISKLVKLNVQFGGMVIDPYGNEKTGFTIKGNIKRNDWGLNWNAAIEAGGFVVSDEVMISCELELINVGQKDLVMVLEPTENKKVTL
jgi:polyisoprenoid-binding protein YceI